MHDLGHQSDALEKQLRLSLLVGGEGAVANSVRLGEPVHLVPRMVDSTHAHRNPLGLSLELHHHEEPRLAIGDKVHHGWLVARRFGGRELYALLDARYATIAEVQSAMRRLRETLLGNIFCE